MALRSHVDPVLYSRFILFDESEIEPEHISILTAPATAPGSTDAVGRVLSDALKRHPRVAFHEAYHCFQGLRIPFLHRYAVIVWYSFGKAFEHLCQGSEDHRSWVLEDAPLLGLLSEKFQCTRTAGDILGKPLSVLDIVEGVTSLVEWQLYAQEHNLLLQSTSSFRQWQKRCPMYSKLYDITERAIGSHRALLSAVFLGTATLYTSKPLLALNNILSILEEKLKDAKFARRFDFIGKVERGDLIFGLLDQLNYDASVNASHDLSDVRLFRLRLPLGASLPRTHPFFAHANAPGIFSEDVSEIDGFRHLVHPEMYPDIRGVFEDNGIATMTFIKVRLRDGTFRGQTHIHANYAAPYTRDDSRDTVIDFARWNSIITGVIRRISGRFYTQQRTCELRDCPEWPHNFCSTYIYTPSVHTKCTFLFELGRLRKGCKR